MSPGDEMTQAKADVIMAFVQALSAACRRVEERNVLPLAAYLDAKDFLLLWLLVRPDHDGSRPAIAALFEIVDKDRLRFLGPASAVELHPVPDFVKCVGERRLQVISGNPLHRAEAIEVIYDQDRVQISQPPAEGTMTWPPVLSLRR